LDSLWLDEEETTMTTYPATLDLDGAEQRHHPDGQPYWILKTGAVFDPIADRAADIRDLLETSAARTLHDPLFQRGSTRQ
jgi:hypothetical protein